LRVSEIAIGYNTFGDVGDVNGLMDGVAITRQWKHGQVLDRTHQVGYHIVSVSKHNRGSHDSEAELRRSIAAADAPLLVLKDELFGFPLGVMIALGFEVVSDGGENANVHEVRYRKHLAESQQVASHVDVSSSESHNTTASTTTVSMLRRRRRRRRGEALGSGFE